MTFGSLFAGVGGIDLGLERAGMECRWQVEIDPFCRRVLAKHWPTIRRHDDVRTFPPSDPEEWSVDLIAGGFPCQDISFANPKGKGIDGDRSGLWSSFADVLRLLRPRYAIVENSPALLVRGFGRVLGDLAEIGFDAQWFCLSAAAFGARHLRERLFVVAASRAFHDPDGISEGPISEREIQSFRRRMLLHRGRTCIARGPWAAEPGLRRVANGISGRMDRNRRRRGIGNAVVPQVAEWIGRRILESVKESPA